MATKILLLLVAAVVVVLYGALILGENCRPLVARGWRL